MMKRRTMTRRLARIGVLAALFVCMNAQALADDGTAAQRWMEQFAQALEQLVPLNDAEQTSDPARAGQYLIEYEFGTVLASVPETPVAQEILEIDVRTGQVTDCRGVRVGMGLEAALGGEPVGAADSALVVLSTQEADCSWSWAYVGEGGVYGVEYIAYAGSESGMTEYTLTYVIEDGVIAAIRMKAAEATSAQAQDGLRTAQEIEERQNRERIALRNEEPVFGVSDLQVQGGAALGVPVADLIARMGEPQNVQTLPQAQGRLLLYDGAAVRLAFNEATGEELVRGVSVSSAVLSGPRGLTVGMPVQTAAGLFACEADVTVRGGTLYLAGEAEGEAPYGEAVASGS
ncbi:MAG: hypothetical protein ACI4MP_04080, partial [Candidatus Ventricola sp.]